MSDKELNEFPYAQCYNYCYDKDKDKEEQTLITTWNVNLNNINNINSNNNNSNNETACNSWIDFDDWPTNDIINNNNIITNTKCEYYCRYPLYLPINFHIKQEFTTSSFYIHTNDNDDDNQRCTNTLRNLYVKLSSSTTATTKQVLFKSMSSLFMSEYFISKISSIKKTKSSFTSFDFNADFIPFQRHINTITLYKEPLIDKYPKLKCVICNKQHYPIQCPRRHTMLPTVKCSTCNKQAYHFEEECLSNHSLYESNNTNNEMKWCFKCGKFGHLYCNAQHQNEKAFFYEYENITSDDESNSNNNNTNKRKLNNNYHNPDVLVNVKESLLMNDNNFFDSADNIVI